MPLSNSRKKIALITILTLGATGIFTPAGAEINKEIGSSVAQKS